jgi:uncharacterized SAM-binding protein YcdF (DUF218 family)
VFVLTKILPVFCYPLGLSLILGLAGILALLLKKYRTALIFVFAAVALLWAASTPFFAARIVRSLESRYAPTAEFPSVPAIVTLGGGEVPPVPPRIYPELSDLGDRLVHAARLYHQGRAPYVVTTGGIDQFDPWPGSHAAVSADILVSVLNVPRAAILMEEEARNTYEHPTGVRKALAGRGLAAEIILVTSALHMPRTVKVFESQGFTVYPAPTDFAANAESGMGIMSFIPNAVSLERTTRAVHEYYGLLPYKVLGRI